MSDMKIHGPATGPSEQAHASHGAFRAEPPRSPRARPAEPASPAARRPLAGRGLSIGALVSRTRARDRWLDLRLDSGLRLRPLLALALQPDAQGGDADAGFAEARSMAASILGEHHERADNAAQRQLVMDELQCMLENGQASPAQLRGYFESLPAAELDLCVRALAAHDPAKPHAALHIARAIVMARMPTDHEPRADTPRTRPKAAMELIPTSDAIARQVGRKPHPDFAFGGFTLLRRDLAYKQVLKRLDAYRHAVDAAPQGKPMEADHAAPVRANLLALIDSLRKACMDPRCPNPAAMNRQLLHFEGELAMLDHLLEEHKASPGRFPDDLRTCRAQKRQAAGALFDEALKPGSRFTVKLAETALREGVLSPVAVRAVAIHGLPWSLAHEAATRSAADRAAIKPIGSGVMNTVYSAEVTLPDGTAFRGVYKKEAAPGSDLPDAAHEAGIDAARPNWAIRSVATWKIDRLLDIGVTPPTHLVLAGDELGCIMQFVPGRSPVHAGNLRVPLHEAFVARLEADPELLHDMALSQGFARARVEAGALVLENESEKENILGALETRRPDTLASIDFSDGPLRQQLTRMQWLDALTGQLDRNARNYFVAADGHSLKTIDNDMAFAPLHTDPLQARAFLPSLPRVIDRATWDRLMATTPDEIRHCCMGLSAREIDATLSRFAAIRSALAAFTPSQILEESADWSSPGVSTALGVVPAASNPVRSARTLNAIRDAAAKASYVARETLALEEASIGVLQIGVFHPSALERLQNAP